MNVNRKYLILNAAANMLAMVYILLLRNFNEMLRDISSQYDEIFERAIKIMGVSGFFEYLFFGAIFIVFLIVMIVVNWKSINIVMIEKIIYILLNISILLVLLIAFADPILTTVAVIAGGAALTYSAK